MPSRDVAILAAETGAAPLEYTVPNAQEIMPLAVTAEFDGTGAAVAFLPTVEIVNPGGVVIARVPATTSVAAGASAEVTFAPFLRGASAAAPSTSVAAWCLLSRTAALTVASGVPTNVPWAHFTTSDQTVFTTKPNGAAGDTTLRLLGTGTYLIGTRAVWNFAGATARGAYLGTAGNDMATDAFSPATQQASGTAALGGLWTFGSWSMFQTFAPPPPYDTALVVQQNSGVPQSLSSSVTVAGFFWPSQAGTAVY